MHRGGCRLLQKATAAGDVTAFADQPQRRPERGLSARDHGNAVAVFEWLRHAERAQSAAGNEQALGLRRLRADLGAERDDIRLALLAGLRSRIGRSPPAPAPRSLAPRE